jgi:hypothetical protein
MQTQGFNYLYEDLWKACDSHVEKIRLLETSLPLQNALTSLQGVLNAGRESDFKFGEMIRDALEKMNLFSEDEIEFVMKQNVEFIKSSTLMEKGGSYSEGEIEWYSGMLKEVNFWGLGF